MVYVALSSFAAQSVLTAVFDAADGTNNRLHQSSLRMVNISRIFVTHMHADHILGIVAIMAVIMSGVGQTPTGLERLRAQGTAKKVGCGA